MRLLVVVPLLALPIAACGSGSSPEAGSRPDANAASAAQPAPGPSADGARPAEREVAVNLDPEGVRLVEPESGASSLLSFGTARSQAVAVLDRGFGAAPEEQTLNAECGAGPILHVRWRNGFVGLFQEDDFLGWTVLEPGLSTADGIGIGSPRTTVESSRTIEVEETTLGTEFSAGDLGGLFESAAPDAPVTALWAGLTCLFR